MPRTKTLKKPFRILVGTLLIRFAGWLMRTENPTIHGIFVFPTHRKPMYKFMLLNPAEAGPIYKLLIRKNHNILK